jgi:hypothetical protein
MIVHFLCRSAEDCFNHVKVMVAMGRSDIETALMNSRFIQSLIAGIPVM